MMKTHLLINNDGLTSCGRNAFTEYLVNTEDIDECTCKNCLKFNRSVSRFDIGSRCGRVFKFGKDKDSGKDDIVIW